MANTNYTTVYRLPKFVESDKPTWLGDFNRTMDLIEAALVAKDAQINTMQSQIVALQTKVGP